VSQQEQPFIQYSQNPYVPQPPIQYKNGVGLAALIVGVVAICFCWVPILNYLTVVMGIIGLILAIVGLVNVRRKVANNSAVAGIALIVNIANLILPFIFLAAFASAVDESVQELDEISNQVDAYGDCLDKADINVEGSIEACDKFLK
jgi:Na+/phosphate symporter